MTTDRFTEPAIFKGPFKTLDNATVIVVRRQRIAQKRRPAKDAPWRPGTWFVACNGDYSTATTYDREAAWYMTNILGEASVIFAGL